MNRTPSFPEEDALPWSPSSDERDSLQTATAKPPAHHEEGLEPQPMMSDYVNLEQNAKHLTLPPTPSSKSRQHDWYDASLIERSSVNKERMDSEDVLGSDVSSLDQDDRDDDGPYDRGYDNEDAQDDKRDVQAPLSRNKSNPPNSVPLIAGSSTPSTVSIASRAFEGIRKFTLDGPRKYVTLAILLSFIIGFVIWRMVRSRDSSKSTNGALKAWDANNMDRARQFVSQSIRERDYADRAALPVERFHHLTRAASFADQAHSFVNRNELSQIAQRDFGEFVKRLQSDMQALSETIQIATSVKQPNVIPKMEPLATHTLSSSPIVATTTNTTKHTIQAPGPFSFSYASSEDQLPPLEYAPKT